MYSFIFLFLATIGYFVYFDAVQSKDIITHPGNIHIAKLQDHRFGAVFWRLTVLNWPEQM